MACIRKHKVVPEVHVWTWVLPVAFIVFAVIGCAGTSGPVKPHAPLDARFEVSEPVTVISVVPQEEIVKNYDRSFLSNPTLTTTPSYYSPSTQATGLLVGVAIAAIEKGMGEAIEKSRQEEAERELIPLLAVVDDVDFRSEFWSAMEQSLLQTTWMDVKGFQRTTNIADATVKELTREPKITIVTGYSLTKEYAFVSETLLQYYIAGTKDPAYKLVFKYYDDPFKEQGNSEEKINAWAADNGRAYREVVVSVIEDTLTVVKSNFLNPRSSRQVAQLHAHDPDHEILAKELGFVVSVPIGYNSKGSKVSSERNKQAVSGSVPGDEINHTFSGNTALDDRMNKGMSVKSFYATD